jgi:hypothetical protein
LSLLFRRSNLAALEARKGGTNTRALLASNEAVGSSYVSTGHLPTPELVTALMAEAHTRYKSNTEGENSQVYPAPAEVPSELFGVCVVGTSGNV